MRAPAVPEQAVGAVLVGLDARPLQYTLGAGRDVQVGSEIRLDEVLPAATLTGHEWPECLLSETDLAGRAIEEEKEPYLRI